MINESDGVLSSTFLFINTDLFFQVEDPVRVPTLRPGVCFFLIILLVYLSSALSFIHSYVYIGVEFFLVK